MNEIDFRNWMAEKGVKKKILGDYVSRLKRIERELENCDLDECYENDRCEYLMSLFVHMGNNEEMKKYSNANFPVGKYYMNTYRHALRRYVLFCDEKDK